MRILYLHQYFVPPSSHGGTRSYEFARRLIANGHEVCLITSAAALPEEYRYINKVTEMTVAGISLVIVPVPYSNEMQFAQRIKSFFQFALRASIEVMRRQSDVVFATSTPLTIAIPGIAGRLRHGIPMVFEVRDLWPELPIAVNALSNPLAKCAAYLLEWIAYHSSAHVIALSPGIAEGILRRGISKNRVSVIPNGCDIEIFDIPAEHGIPIRERLGLSIDQPLIVYAGTFGLINRLEYLVHLATHIRNIDPSIHFLLVGTGAKKDDVVREAEELGVLGENLTVWDPIPKEEIPLLLAAATVAVSLFMPLKPMWNNSANKFFDALAAGKPIVINYGGWHADLLNQSGAGIVLPQDVSLEAAEKLVCFVKDNARLQIASRAARNLAHTEFNRNMMAAQVENILRSVVANRI